MKFNGNIVIFMDSGKDRVNSHLEKGGKVYQLGLVCWQEEPEATAVLGWEQREEAPVILVLVQ